MNVTLKLRYSAAPLHPPRAWLIPGSEPERWLAEMAAWGVPLADARLLPLPAADGGIAGVVVVPGGQCPARVETALPYGQLAGRLLLPVEAALDPPLTEEEIDDLLPAGDALLVWHPRAGLLRFDRDAQLSVAQLLAPPPRSDRDWDAARPGVAVNQRLLSIEPLVQPSLEQFLQASRDDIGGQPLTSGALPKAPGEPAGGAAGRAMACAGKAAAAHAAGAVAAAAGAIGHALQQLTGQAGREAAHAGAGSATSAATGGAATGEGWLSRLKRWAEQRRDKLRQDLDRLRHREIERLLHALQHSPDDGLRFALPFGPGRQGYPPGAQLPEHSVDFSLNAINSGGPVDFWNLSADHQQRLMQAYRELANREIRLGRHRRAAYIFAELLGDLTSAAATLADGGHFREAAALYEHRLKQPQAAARCLERGGLWAEAIAIFERLGQWETVGDLYQRLDQREEAARAYRRAVEVRLAAHDRLGAAKLLEDKLDAPQEALETLIAAWPHSAQAEPCVDEAFQLLARRRDHARAVEQIAALHRATVAPTKFAPLAARLARVAGEYPNDDVRRSAAEATRSLASLRLGDASLTESQSLLQSLAALVPGDRLLERDCRRFQDQRAEAVSRLVTQRPRRTSARLPRRVHWFRLPPGLWKTAVSIGEEFYAAGWHRDWLILARGQWDGSIQIPAGEPWKPPRELRSRSILLAADPRGLGPVYVFVSPGHPDRVLMFPPAPAPDGHWQPRTARPHPGFSETLLGMCYGDGGSVLLAHRAGDESIQMAAYGGSTLEGTETIKIPLDAFDGVELQSPLPLLMRQGIIYFAVGQQLITNHGVQETTRVHSPIRHITGSAPHTRARVVLACEQGGVVIWGKSDLRRETTFALDLLDPVVGLTRGGWLAAATSDAIQVYGTHDGRLSFVGEVEGPGQSPVAVLPTSDTDQFALLLPDGGVSIYQVPRR